MRGADSVWAPSTAYSMTDLGYFLQGSVARVRMRIARGALLVLLDAAPDGVLSSSASVNPPSIVDPTASTAEEGLRDVLHGLEVQIQHHA